MPTSSTPEAVGRGAARRSWSPSARTRDVVGPVPRHRGGRLGRARVRRRRGGIGGLPRATGRRSLGDDVRSAGPIFVPARAHAGLRDARAAAAADPSEGALGGPGTSHERARDDAPSAADDPAPESASSARSWSSRANRHRGRDHHHHHHHRHPPRPRVDDDRSPPLPRRVANVLANVLGRLRAAPTMRLTREVAARARAPRRARAGRSDDAEARGGGVGGGLRRDGPSPSRRDWICRAPRRRLRVPRRPPPHRRKRNRDRLLLSPLSPPPLGFLSYDVEAGLDPDGASRAAVAAVAETRAIVLPLKKTLARGHGGVVELTAGVSLEASAALTMAASREEQEEARAARRRRRRRRGPPPMSGDLPPGGSSSDHEPPRPAAASDGSPRLERFASWWVEARLCRAITARVGSRVRLSSAPSASFGSGCDDDGGFAAEFRVRVRAENALFRGRRSSDALFAAGPRVRSGGVRRTTQNVFGWWFENVRTRVRALAPGFVRPGVRPEQRVGARGGGAEDGRGVRANARGV